MRGLKRFFVAVILAVMLIITGCGQNAEENREDTASPVEQEESGQQDDGDALPEAEGSEETQDEDEFLFRFVVRDAFEISEEGAVVTGFVYRGTMRAGDAALLLKEDGTILEVRVKQMEVKDKETDKIVTTDEVQGVEEGAPAGVWLEGIESEQIDNADILLGIEQ